MTGNKTTPGQTRQAASEHPSRADSYYALLGLHPSASAIEIRRAYRKLSKHYHPDTTQLPKTVATAKFQKLNEAYATLSNPERRQAYDIEIRYSRYHVIQASDSWKDLSANPPYRSSSSYLDPTDRPLSAGELFALFIMGFSLIACLILAIIIGVTRSDLTLKPIEPPPAVIHLKLISDQAVAIAKQNHSL